MQRALLILCLTLPATVLAQRDTTLEQRRRLATTTVPPSAEQLLAMRSARITRALQSAESLYRFVTRPEPSYLERRAAALQSKGLIPVDWVPRLWRDIGALRREQAIHSWGLKPHPFSSAPYIFAPAASGAPSRTVLGARWTPPKEAIEFPLTTDELERAPWPWQVEQALMDVYGGLVPSTYAPLERERATAYLAAVLTMPCATDDEAQLFVQATQFSSHFKTPAVMGALRNIALNERFGSASIQAAGMYADATRLWDDPRAWSIGAAGLRSMLRESAKRNARESATYWIRSLREGFRGTTVRRPLPAAVVIDASRLALDPAAGDAWTRLYVYAFSVVEALDDPPFASERNLSPQSPRVAQLLIEFARWFETHRAELELLARDQQPELDGAERLMASAKCRS